MRRKSRHPTRKTLAVVTQFEKWRKTKSSGARIPDRLWSAAIKLCARQSVHQVSRALRVNGTDLKRRVEDASQSDVSGSATRPAFVEVVPAPCTSTAECVVEFEDPRGVKMKIHFKAVGQAELTALGRLFWRSER